MFLSSGMFIVYDCLFYLLFLLGVLLSVSSTNWILVWLGMEIAFFSLFPLMLKNNKYVSLNKEAALKYFIIQSFSSSLLLISGFSLSLLMIDNESLLFLLKVMFIMGLCIKLGIFPAHFWVISVIGSMNMMGMFLVLTISKIPVLSLLNMFLTMNCDKNMFFYVNMMYMFLGMTSMIAGFLGSNVSSYWYLIMASSIGHSSWLLLGCISGELWPYFVLYSFTLSVLILKTSLQNKKSVSFIILSLSGLPPFILFLGKFLILKTSFTLGISSFWLIFPILGVLIGLSYYLFYFYYLFMGSTILNMNNFEGLEKHFDEFLILLFMLLFLVLMIYI
nr:NADH dehydrogenase subunit 2 [Runcina aurata]